MKIQKKNLILGALALAAALGSMASSAATITQCSLLARPAGYLTVQTGIGAPACSTSRMANKYETPRENLVIKSWSELETIAEPWGVIRIDGFTPNLQYTIRAAREGLQVCSLFPPPYNWASKKAGIMGNCGQVSNFSDSVIWHKIFTASLGRKPGAAVDNLYITLNPKLNSSVYYYTVRTTATLNGASTTVEKRNITGNSDTRLAALAPSLVNLAKQGAKVTFEIDVFSGLDKVSNEVLTADGTTLAN